VTVVIERIRAADTPPHTNQIAEVLTTVSLDKAVYTDPDLATYKSTATAQISLEPIITIDPNQLPNITGHDDDDDDSGGGGDDDEGMNETEKIALGVCLSILILIVLGILAWFTYKSCSKK
jgi:hypothetical protein